MNTIKDETFYKRKLKYFESNLKVFFKLVGKSFLMKGEVIGDYETFYMRCLNCYIPEIAWITYQNNHLGVDVFTMQGCERRNQEAKHGHSHHSNVTGDVYIQVL